MPLTVKAINAAAPRDKPYKLADEKGLYLLISPTGFKSWRWKYRYLGKEQKLNLGTYPEVSLAEARDMVLTYRKGLQAGQRPTMLHKAKDKQEGDLFEPVAREWLAKRERQWVEKTLERAKLYLERDVFPEIGAMGMRAIEPDDVLRLLRKVEARKTYEVAHRILQLISQIFRYGVATSRVKYNPAADLKDALTPLKKGHFASLNGQEMPKFMQAVREFSGTRVVHLGLLLLLHTFVRTSDLRFATWEEFDFKEKLWRVPNDRMKMRNDKTRLYHLVPLSTQVVAMLEELHTINGEYTHILAHPHWPDQVISENAFLAAIYRMGYKGRATGHGIRTTASSILHEQGYNSDAIEMQLAHMKTGVKGVYTRHAQHLPERREIMQWWSDYLDSL